MAERDPRHGHPDFEPSIPPRRPATPGIPGTRLPAQRGAPAPTHSIAPAGERKTAKRAARAGKTVLIIGAIGGLVTGVLQAVPGILSAGKPAPEVAAVTPATQPAMDTANAEIQRLKKCVSLLAQALCQINGGSLSPEWDCDSDAFKATASPPPTIRGDKVFPCGDQ